MLRRLKWLASGLKTRQENLSNDVRPSAVLPHSYPVVGSIDTRRRFGLDKLGESAGIRHVLAKAAIPIETTSTRKAGVTRVPAQLERILCCDLRSLAIEAA